MRHIISSINESRPESCPSTLPGKTLTTERLESQESTDVAVIGLDPLAHCLPDDAESLLDENQGQSARCVHRRITSGLQRALIGIADPGQAAGPEAAKAATPARVDRPARSSGSWAGASTAIRRWAGGGRADRRAFGRGGPDAFRWSFLLMAAATIVDSTDGFLARKVRIKEVVPSFDGRRLDDLVDFLNYTFLPLLLIWRAEHPSQPGRNPGCFCRCSRVPTVFARCRPRPTTAISWGSRRSGTSWPFISTCCRWGVGVAGRRGRAGDPDLRAHAPPLSVATRPAQSPGDAAGRSLDFLFVWLIWRLPHGGRNAVLTHSTLQWAWISLAYPVFYLGVSWAISVATGGSG